MKKPTDINFGIKTHITVEEKKKSGIVKIKMKIKIKKELYSFVWQFFLKSDSNTNQ